MLMAAAGGIYGSSNNDMMELDSISESPNGILRKPVHDYEWGSPTLKRLPAYFWNEDPAGPLEQAIADLFKRNDALKVVGINEDAVNKVKDLIAPGRIEPRKLQIERLSIAYENSAINDAVKQKVREVRNLLREKVIERARELYGKDIKIPANRG